KIWRGMPSHGMDTAAILKNIGYSENLSGQPSNRASRHSC
ncbi:hypothetical protein O5165_25505, partial [Escherichia coli]|nr:hypothetical protein [Escherichia coli]